MIKHDITTLDGPDMSQQPTWSAEKDRAWKPTILLASILSTGAGGPIKLLRDPRCFGLPGIPLEKTNTYKI